MADAPHAGFLILHLRNYAAWQIRVNGRLVAFGADGMMTPLPHRDDGLMAVPVPQGHIELAADWATTGDEIIGRWLSAVALIFFIGLWLLEQRLAPQSRPTAPSQQ
jgi:hypothetical protein